MEPKEAYAGNFGYNLTLKGEGDLTDAQVMKLKIRTPSNVRNEVLLNHSYLDLERKQFTYQVMKGDFRTPGTYRLQLFKETIDGSRMSASPVYIMKVKPSLDYIEPRK